MPAAPAVTRKAAIAFAPPHHHHHHSPLSLSLPNRRTSRGHGWAHTNMVNAHAWWSSGALVMSCLSATPNANACCTLSVPEAAVSITVRHWRTWCSEAKKPTDTRVVCTAALAATAVTTAKTLPWIGSQKSPNATVFADGAHRRASSAVRTRSHCKRHRSHAKASQNNCYVLFLGTRGDIFETRPILL